MSNIHPTTRTFVFTGLLVLAFIALAANWTMAKQEDPYSKTSPARTGNLSKAYLTVSNMSCGGCVDTITKGLSAIAGIADISVNVATGKAEVFFDSDILEDHQKIAQVITKAGYPAKIARIESAMEVRRQENQAAIRAKTLIASVGRIEIARQDYTTELGHARSRYEQIYGKDVFASEQGVQLLQRIKSQIVQRLVDEGIKLQEIDRTGYTISKSKINQAFNEYLDDKDTTIKRLKANLEANSYPFDYFYKKFSNKIRLQHYLESEIFGNTLDEDARQQKYGHWLANARVLAAVTYYDKALEKLVLSGSGSSCSGGGTGGCASSR